MSWVEFGNVAAAVAVSSALNSLWRRVNIALRNHDAAVSSDPHNGECVHPRLTEPSEHCMA